MKYLVPFLCLLFSYSVQAQDEPHYPDMRSWGFTYADSIDAYIFADTALVRVSTDTKQKPADTLLAGDHIKVLEVTQEALTLRGLKGPWLRVSYTKNNEGRTGYVWQGLVSCKPLRRGDTKFVYAIERKADSVVRQEDDSKIVLPRYLVRVKVIKNGQILARAAFMTPNDESANFSDARIMSGMGLTGVQQIVVLSFTGAACAIPTYDYYFAWTQDSLFVRLPDKMNVADAGAAYHTETFTFPNEKKGKPDLIRWDMTEEEATEEEKDGEPVLKVTDRQSVVYAWDFINKKITVVKP